MNVHHQCLKVKFYQKKSLGQGGEPAVSGKKKVLQGAGIAPLPESLC